MVLLSQPVGYFAVGRKRCNTILHQGLLEIEFAERVQKRRQLPESDEPKRRCSLVAWWGLGAGFAGLLGDLWGRIPGMAHIEFFLVAGSITAGPTFSPTLPD